QAGLTLGRASELSYIKPAVLAAIESGETAAIPSVYLKGYVRNYARFLGVDSASIEQSLQHLRGSEPLVQSVFTVPSARGRTEKWLKASSYLAATAVIAALVWQFTHEAVRFSQRDSELASTAAAPTEVTDQVASESPAEKRPAKSHLNASIASMELIERHQELGGKAVAEQAWAAIGGQADGDEPQADPHLDAGAEPQAGSRRLAITTSADTWVEIHDGEGDQLELDLIRAGSEREYRGSGPFRVMIGRASAVVLSLDGEAVDLGPHTRGNVARLTLGEEAQAGDEPTAEGEPAAAGEHVADGGQAADSDNL
ncbi:MAG: helix-turn-helix domain-containing protein, partial [Lysobacterales bacterium]